MTPLLVADQLTKTYGDSSVLRQVSLIVQAGEYVALMGPSGCGKSTLFNLIGTLDTPTSGQITLEGESLDTRTDAQLSAIRNGRVGFVFQFFNLLPTLTVLENVLVPLELAGRGGKTGEASARHWLDYVGLSHRLGHWPAQLSGGEMQRVAIARALVNQPVLLLADEPTGNLDTQRGEQILELFDRLNRDEGLTILMATHSEEAARRAHRIVRLRDGAIVADERVTVGV